MANATCTHNWCERQMTSHGYEAYVHESKGASVAGLSNSTVTTQVSYEDGDREPLLYVGGNDVELKADGVAELVAILQEQLLIMRSVQPTAPLASAA